MKEQIIAILKDFKHGKISVDTAECQIEAAIAEMPTEEIQEFINDVAEWDKDYSSTNLKLRAITLRNRMSKPNNCTGGEG